MKINLLFFFIFFQLSFLDSYSRISVIIDSDDINYYIGHLSEMKMHGIKRKIETLIKNNDTVGNYFTVYSEDYLEYNEYEIIEDDTILNRSIKFDLDSNKFSFAKRSYRGLITNLGTFDEEYRVKLHIQLDSSLKIEGKELTVRNYGSYKVFEFTNNWQTPVLKSSYFEVIKEDTAHLFMVYHQTNDTDHFGIEIRQNIIQENDSVVFKGFHSSGHSQCDEITEEYTMNGNLVKRVHLHNHSRTITETHTYDSKNNLLRIEEFYSKKYSSKHKKISEYKREYEQNGLIKVAETKTLRGNRVKKHWVRYFQYEN